MQLILALFASVFLRLLRITWRVRLLGPSPFVDDGVPRVFCFWHGRQLGLFAHPQKNQLAVLASLSRDGALQSGILQRLGFCVCRGSSSRRGAAGLKGIIDALKDGRDGAFAVDGPRGPLHKVKPGAILAAKKAGASLIPITTRYGSCWTFLKAWDSYAIPKPFSRVDILRGAAISTEGQDVRTLSEKLEHALMSLENASVPKEETWEAFST